MKLENQVVSLPIAKRLKELGVKQESYFYHYKGIVETMEGLDEWAENHIGVMEIAYSAFTVAELGEILPKLVQAQQYLVELRQTKSENGKNHGITGFTTTGQVFIEMICAPTEADCRGKMLIHLIENGLIKLEK